MKRMKRLTAIMILAAVASISTPHAFGGPGETPGFNALQENIAIAGPSETPGLASILLGDLAGIMLGDIAGIMLGD